MRFHHSQSTLWMMQYRGYHLFKMNYIYAWYLIKILIQNLPLINHNVVINQPLPIILDCNLSLSIKLDSHLRFMASQLAIGLLGYQIFFFFLEEEAEVVGVESDLIKIVQMMPFTLRYWGFRAGINHICIAGAVAPSPLLPLSSRPSSKEDPNRKGRK